MLMKKMKRKPFKAWLDALCRTVVKERDGWQCQKCNEHVQGIDAHWSHVEPRRVNTTRWDLLNSLCLCSKCHAWWHAHPFLAFIWFNAKFPSRHEYLSEPIDDGFGKMKPRSTITGGWADEDFLEVERVLLGKAKDLGIMWDMFPKQYQARYKKAR